MRLIFTERAKKDWQNLDLKIRKQLRKKVAFYLRSGMPLRFAEKLKDPALGEFRFRIGDYRITFDVIHDAIVVLRSRHRKDIY